MLKRRKTLQRRRKLLNVASSRRRIKRNIIKLEQHRRRFTYQTFFRLHHNHTVTTQVADAE